MKPSFVQDDPVVVTAGLAQGLKGHIVQRAEILFGGMPMYAVRFPMPLGLRVIRGDYLRKVPS